MGIQIICFNCLGYNIITSFIASVTSYLNPLWAFPHLLWNAYLLVVLLRYPSLLPPRSPMASRTYAIANIDSANEDWNIIARVLRLWSVCMGARSRNTTSLEMILVDQEGSRIHASVRKHFVKKFERVLKEGSVYSFRGFSISTNGGEYRITKHEWRINIHGNTKVVLVADNLVPLPGYVFTPLPEILDSLHDPSYLIDVMGILTSVGEERSITKSGNITKMNVIELQNAGVNITCALWGAYVDQLNIFTATAGTDTIIVALFGVKIKEFQGKTSLQNSMHSTKLVFNPQIIEAIELKRSLSNDVPCTQGVRRLTSSGMPALADDLLTLTEPKKISQLSDLADDIGGCFTVLGTIQCLDEPDDWWYLACKCHRVVYPDSVAYFCDACKRRVLDVAPRYRIKFTVVDETGFTGFVMFDRAAASLFNKECSDMVNEFEKDDGGDDCPTAISGLVDREYLFKVEVKCQSTGNFEPTHTVKRLTDDPEIINKFKVINVGKEIGVFGSSVASSKVSPHATAPNFNPEALVSEFGGGFSVGCHDLGGDVDCEPLLLVAPVDGAGTSMGKNNADDFGTFRVNESSKKRIAVDVVEIGNERLKPKLLKSIKIEKL